MGFLNALNPFKKTTGKVLAVPVPIPPVSSQPYYPQPSAPPASSPPMNTPQMIAKKLANGEAVSARNIEAAGLKNNINQKQYNIIEDAYQGPMLRKKRKSVLPSNVSDRNLVYILADKKQPLSQNLLIKTQIFDRPTLERAGYKQKCVYIHQTTKKSVSDDFVSSQGGTELQMKELGYTKKCTWLPFAGGERTRKRKNPKRKSKTRKH